MSGNEESLERTLVVLGKLAAQSLPLWELPKDARVRLINVSENATYLVEAPDHQAILRIHRDNYHSENAIECELAWADALRESGTVMTPRIYPGKNGKRIQCGIVTGLPAPRFMVLSEFVEGQEPDEAEDLEAHFEELGEIAALTHNHSISWGKPAGFERLIWDADAVFGANPTWGDWRDGPDVTPAVRSTLEQVEATVKARLQAFGKGPDRFGLIHADMRLANLLISDGGITLIDFDDCGLGWFLYDFATGISFFEDDERVPALKTAWVKGYRKARDLNAAEEHEIDTFVMLRRMALLAWIGSHIEAPEPQRLAPGFAATTARLGQAYLDSIST